MRRSSHSAHQFARLPHGGHGQGSVQHPDARDEPAILINDLRFTASFTVRSDRRSGLRSQLGEPACPGLIPWKTL